MAIFLNDDIECRKAEPLDTRVRVPNQAGLTSLNTPYNYAGMLVVTLDTLGVYQLKASVSGSTITDWELKSFITPTQASDIVTNNSKISYTDSAAVALNTLKVGVTPAQTTILSNTSGTNTGDQTASSLGAVTITGNQSIGGDKIFTGATVADSLAAYRPVINKTASFTLSATELNKGCKLDITTAVVISVDASSDSAFPVGGEIEFYWYSDSGSNTITITASGGQTVVSADAAITLSKVGSCAVLKKVAASSWILTGGLA